MGFEGQCPRFNKGWQPVWRKRAGGGGEIEHRTRQWTIHCMNTLSFATCGIVCLHLPLRCVVHSVWTGAKRLSLHMHSFCSRLEEGEWMNQSTKSKYCCLSLFLSGGGASVKKFSFEIRVSVNVQISLFFCHSEWMDRAQGYSQVTASDSVLMSWLVKEKTRALVCGVFRKTRMRNRLGVLHWITLMSGVPRYELCPVNRRTHLLRIITCWTIL